jgi:hypothetical protein
MIVRYAVLDLLHGATIWAGKTEDKGKTEDFLRNLI